MLSWALLTTLKGVKTGTLSGEGSFYREGTSFDRDIVASNLPHRIILYAVFKPTPSSAG